MNTRKIFGNTVLVLGLLTTGASFAEDTGTTSTATPEQKASYGKEVRAKMANMTPEQREAFRAEMKAKMDKMTPEQRAEMREKMHDKMEQHNHADKAERMEHHMERPGK